MPRQTLKDCRILVAEDEYMLADEIRNELEGAGGIVLGPVGHLADVLDLIEAEQEIDVAVLDVNLGGEKVFVAADRLIARKVPIVFTTGYDAMAIPIRYERIARCEKPVDLARITEAIGKCIAA